MKISVVIPAYNAEKTIEACLKALSHQTFPQHDYEIIVVDDGSADSTQAILRDHEQINLLTQANAGPAAARNLGAAHANGEIILFTDADCIPKEDWVEQMVYPFRQLDVVGVKGAYLSSQPGLIARFVQLEYEDKYDRMRKQEYIDFIDTYSAAYRRDVFCANGGFDQAFPTASVEDQEFSFRLARQGLKLVFNPLARVYHSGHADSMRSYFRKKFRIGYWKVLVHRRHPDKMLSDSHTPQILKVQILLAGMGGLALILLPFTPWPGILVWSTFLITTLPFIVKAWPKDKAVAIASPLILLLRAYALGTGFMAGIVDNFRNHTTF